LLGGTLAGLGPSQEVTAAAPQHRVAPSRAAGVAPSPATASRRRDGRIIFFNSDTGQLETSNPDGSARRFVTPAGEVAVDASWARDGSHIVYSSNRGGDDFRLFVARADGTGRRQVTGDAAGFSNFSPTFTRDGGTIIYTRCRPDPPGGCALFSVPARGGGARHALTAFEDRADLEPDVSPGGRRIAFARFGFRGIQIQVWVMRLDGTHAHPITTPGLEAGSPRWTPDGRHLLVTSDFIHLGENIVRIRDDGTAIARLTHPRFPHSAEWADPSPSGARIVFSDDRAYPQIIGLDLFVMRRDGQGKHAITRHGLLFDADWGTAPLATTTSSSRQAFKEAHPLTQQRLAALPPWARVDLGVAHARALIHAGSAWRSNVG